VVSPDVYSSGTSPEVLLVAGTGPEAVRLAPLARALDRAGRLKPVLISGDLKMSRTRRTGCLTELSSALVAGLGDLMDRSRPAAVVVHGDTTTATMAAQVAFWRRIPVVHMADGSRSSFPDEANRKIIGDIAAIHLSPTQVASDNLRAEGIGKRSVLTIGNTVVDAVLDVAARTGRCTTGALDAVVRRARAGTRRLVLVTAHSRELWGVPLARVLRAVADLVRAHPRIEVVLPVHPNPAVTQQVRAALDGMPRILLTDALTHPDLVRLLSVATLVLSDSGGIQEEAPSFGVPVLVLRDAAERREAVDAGCARLVGTDHHRIVQEGHRLLTDEPARLAMTATGNPFGDGLAAGRAEEAIAWLLGLCPRPPGNFAPALRSA
jgi:UDP-N-acetylglucosamine 2-epimerase (non-hydrolysing)